ncbi:MAG: phosphoglycerate kinase [Aigarchaeota archaeon]|nr:phosphoglycerate kinase [Aigarchaeota archaeon]
MNSVIGDFLTIDDLDLNGKRVFLRADINSSIDPKTGKILNANRIEEATVTIRELKNSVVVVGSHQGRVGKYDYVSLEEHTQYIAEYVGRKTTFVMDVMGKAALDAIRSAEPGDVLVLDNLRFAAEENFEFTLEDAAKTVMVKRLSKVIDACVLDAFPSAHRAHPSIIGFADLVPTVAGRLVVKELKSLTKVMMTSKAPFATVLGGSKISDRLEAMSALINGGKGDKILLTGLIGLVFLRAAGVIERPIGLSDEEKLVNQAKRLLSEYRANIELPEDVAISVDDERKEIPVSEIDDPSKVLDIGTKTINRYVKVIKSAGTVFMSGTPGAFEYKGFERGTHELLYALANSLGTTIVSGGHLTTALEGLKIKDWLDHISTSGGALVMFLAGKSMPMFEALKRSAKTWKGRLERN